METQPVVGVRDIRVANCYSTPEMSIKGWKAAYWAGVAYSLIETFVQEEVSYGKVNPSGEWWQVYMRL